MILNIYIYVYIVLWNIILTLLGGGEHLWRNSDKYISFWQFMKI